MPDDPGLLIEADGIPSAELRALVRSTGFDEAAFQSGEHRAVDPGYFAAVVTGVVAIAGPFIAKLADRLFEKAPRARIILHAGEEGQRIEFDADLDKRVRDELIAKAVAASGIRIRIERDGNSTT
jgi:hypothetical protein